MTNALAPYTIHAIKYAHHSRKGSENLIHAGDLVLDPDSSAS